MHPPIQFVAASDGVHVACCVHADTGPPLVFVRGWMSHLETQWADAAFRAYFEPIARRFQLVRFDMRGNGLSDRTVKDVSVDAMALDLEAVMDGLSLERAVLYAQCFGGPAAVLYTVRNPDRVSKLVLDGTYARGSEITTRERQASLIATLRDLPEAGHLFLAHVTYPRRPAIDQPQAAQYVASPEIIPRLYELAFTTDISALLPQLAVPTLVMHSRDSVSIPFALGRAVASGIPNARFVALTGKAHDPWQGDPDVALAAVGEFLGVPLERDRVASPAEAPVTVLFTDIEGSTALTQRSGDVGAQEVVRLHDRIVREMLAAHRGREVKHTGDGIMARFASAARAVQCAIAVQSSLEAYNERHPSSRLRVRIGLNAGEPVEEKGDLFGTAVQLAARVCAHAEPGQILVSNVVRELCAGKPFLFADQGDIVIRGFEDPVRLYEVHLPSEGKLPDSP